MGRFFGTFRGKGQEAAAEPQPQDAVTSDSQQEASRSGELSPESATWRLWKSWNEGSGEQAQMPAPCLALDEVPEGHALQMTDAEITEEFRRLFLKLEERSAERLKRLTEQEMPEGWQAVLPVEYVIQVAQNGMVAWIFIYPPSGGGADFSMEGMAAAMQTAGVVTGIDPVAVGRFIKEKPCFQAFPLAWGIPPKAGRDGDVIEHFPRDGVPEVARDEAGDVDYRAEAYVRSVASGDVICDIIPPEPGVDGMRVTGDMVPAPPVKPARIPGGSNTFLSEDGAQLIAAMEGHLFFGGGVFQVKSILNIEGDVDESTGNINFRGDVHITGDVKENFSVRATGIVTIGGQVEAGTVEAEGDIIITKGVIGDNRALIKSRKSVRVKYLENCVVYSGECTFADCIISAQVYSDDRISVLTGRGAIIGGCLSAANQVEAAIIGSKAGRTTEFILGTLPYVEEEHRGNESEIQTVAGELRDVEQRLPDLEEHQDTDEAAKQLAKLRLRKSVLCLKLDKLTRRQAELEGMSLDLGQCRLTCGTVYPLTSVTIGGSTQTIEDMRSDCTVCYDTEKQATILS